MIGKAILEIPACGVIGHSRTEGLSDAVAMAIGRTAAMTLSDEHQFITVTLESGSVRVIGIDTITNRIFIGRLHPHKESFNELSDCCVQRHV